MNKRKAQTKRETKETQISVELAFDSAEPVSVQTPVPFFNHLLTSMAFHGGFSLVIKATGDVEVDAHHLVEDTGLVLGDVLFLVSSGSDSLKRFGHSVIPMDEALSEVSIDVCGRSYCGLEASFPQQLVGAFDTALLREFFTALAQRAKISLHVQVRRGENSHHMAESLFKALGKTLAAAYQEGTGKGISTKGVIG
ncbi:MAG: imidazoleglycerol-phosphate dehydratase HisB [Spirochaetaceae bacterium]|nr:MAG: imidazoleglycerol-phosphate dehydratase HisB [Spirochaetaceae bacterium]